MRLFRTASGDVLFQRPNEQFFNDENKEAVFYTDYLGNPVDKDGVPVVGEYITKFVHTVDEYLALYPSYERNRHWMNSKAIGGEVLLMQAPPRWSCLPGFMWIVTRYPRFIHPNPKAQKYNYNPCIHIGDGDDCDMRKNFDSEEAAIAGLEELKLLAPFHMSELLEFGYYYP
jgi:hypothetical protein